MVKQHRCSDKLIPKPWSDSQVNHSLFSLCEPQLVNLSREPFSLETDILVLIS